jgi:hypothetical protein
MWLVMQDFNKGFRGRSHGLTPHRFLVFGSFGLSNTSGQGEWCFTIWCILKVRKMTRDQLRQEAPIVCGQGVACESLDQCLTDFAVEVDLF